MAYRPMSLCSMLAASAFGSAAFAGGNPACPNPAHDCFTAGTPGCSDEACCNTVCSADSFCCSVSWDSLCVGEAESLCDIVTCPGLCLGDLDGDGQVNGADLAILLGDWGQSDTCSCLQDCPVDGNDLAILLGAWGPCPPPPTPCDLADHDCCTSGNPGCTDTACCEIVCGADAFCCTVAWDNLCIGEAESLCGIDCGGGDCPPSDHDCCTTGSIGCTDTDCCALVCSADAFCCTVAWDGLCVGEAQSLCGLTCFGCGLGHDCCTTGTPGCSDAACCELVCSVDSFCCSVAWDGLCLAQAISLCGLECAADCPASDHDCFTTGIPGCTDVDCCSQVCVLDSFCCSVAWDGLCVGEAISICGAPPCDFTCTGTDEGEPCGEDTNGGCNSPQGLSNCCFANGGVGCDDAGCQSIVCSVDSFCCSVAWDGLCAGEAVSLCGDLCSGEVTYPFGSLECGETLCGTAWAAGGTRDTDWFKIFNNSGANQTVTLTCSSQLPMIFGLINSIDCATASAINPFGTTGLCSTGSVELCLAPGENWLFAAPNGFDGFPCDSGNNGYSLTVDCGGECVPFGCGTAAHDCYTTGEPTCSDIDCCVAVCSVDSFCCSVAWDGICVQEAFSICGVPPCEFDCSGTDEGEPCGDDTNGGCNSPQGLSNCCFANGGVGCDDAGCQSIVCSVDSFCCSVAWDGLCAGEAVSLCGDLCSGEVTYPFGSLECGETLCGTAWAAGGTRDTDWFKIFVDSATTLTLTCSSQVPMVFGLINSIDCATATAIDPFGVTGFCGTATLDICLEAGENWLFAAPNGFDGFPCDSGSNGYSLTLSCGGECVQPANCCTAWGGLGCEDAECTSIVCAVDSFCCSVAWDGLCAGEALSLCPICGGG